MAIDKITTGELMYGNWLYTKQDGNNVLEVKITLSQNILIIKWLENGQLKDETQLNSINAHWFGDYLCFSEAQRFYVKSATEAEMVFGELTNPMVIGNPKWEYVFKRV